MKVAIVGSRQFEDMEKVRQYVRELPAGTTVISGGAPGVDRIAVMEAQIRGLETIVIPANWGAYGQIAGFLRNTEIVRQADRIVAFWDGESPGTQDTMRKAKLHAKKLEVFR